MRSSTFTKLLLSLSFLVIPALCAPENAEKLTTASKRQAPTQVEPKNDAFYSPVKGYESAKAGTILGSRPVPNPITLDNKTPLVLRKATQIQYRTQNSVGKAEQTLVTVLEPYNAKPENLFIYHFFSVSISTFNEISTLKIFKDAAYNG